MENTRSYSFCQFLCVVQICIGFVFQKLEFTQSVKEPRSPDGKSLPIEKIWDELNRLIVKQNVANEEVIDWIEVS